MALLDELGGGTPSTDTSDGSGSRSDGGSGSSDGGSNEGSNDVGCPLELESPLLPTPAGQGHHTTAAAHQQSHPTAGETAAAAVHPGALVHPPIHGSGPTAVVCTAGDQPAAKRTRLDHSHPATAEPLPHCVTGASDSPLRRSLDLAAGSNGLAPSSLAGIRSGAGSNQVGCEAGSAQDTCHAASEAVTGAGSGWSSHAKVRQLCPLDSFDACLGQVVAADVGVAPHSSALPLHVHNPLQQGSGLVAVGCASQQQQISMAGLQAVDDTTGQHLQLDQLLQWQQQLQTGQDLDTGTSVWCAPVLPLESTLL